MNMTAFIDVAIGLTLLYLGTSLFVTIINEFLAQMLSLRSRQLQTSLKKLFSQEGLKGVIADYQKLIPVQSGTTDSKSKVRSSIFGWLERLLGPKSSVGSYIDPNILARNPSWKTDCRHSTSRSFSNAKSGRRCEQCSAVWSGQPRTGK